MTTTAVRELARNADRAVDAVGSVRAIAVLRIALGPIALLHLRTFLEDLRDGFVAYYRIVQRMLDRGWREDRIRDVLGRSFLRSFEALRP